MQTKLDTTTARLLIDDVYKQAENLLDNLWKLNGTPAAPDGIIMRDKIEDFLEDLRLIAGDL